MNEPRRLLDDPGSSLGHDLLRSAERDAPSRSARRRTLIALGIGTGILGAAGTSAASTGATGVMKWIGIGIVSGGLAVGGAQQAMHIAAPTITAPALKGQERAVRRATGPARAVVRHAVAAPPVAEAPAEIASPDDDVALPQSDADVQFMEAPRARAVPARKADVANLTEETAQLDRAQQALNHGDTQTALEALAQHDKQFGTAVLGPEAMVLRIEARAQSGDKQGAAALANQFLAAYPQGVQANRVRSILARSVSGP